MSVVEAPPLVEPLGIEIPDDVFALLEAAGEEALEVVLYRRGWRLPFKALLTLDEVFRSAIVFPRWPEPGETVRSRPLTVDGPLDETHACGIFRGDELLADGSGTTPRLYPGDRMRLTITLNRKAR